MTSNMRESRLKDEIEHELIFVENIAEAVPGSVSEPALRGALVRCVKLVRHALSTPKGEEGCELDDDPDALTCAYLAGQASTSPWRSIDDMPEEIKRDGVEVLLFHEKGRTWHQVKWRAGLHPVAGHWGMRWCKEYCQYDCDFTHWMPLPEPPVQEEGK